MHSGKRKHYQNTETLARSTMKDGKVVAIFRGSYAFYFSPYGPRADASRIFEDTAQYVAETGIPNRVSCLQRIANDGIF